MTFAGKTYWLIGASEGLGRALAMKLEAAGAKVVVSARSEERLAQIGLKQGHILPMDVTDTASVDQAIEALPEIDGMIYCAGAYDPMTAQTWERDQALKMMDVNLLGAMRVLPGILPEMIARNQGHIVLIGSLSAYHGLPGAVGYSTSKGGLMHLAENLRIDLKSTNIKVQITNPGFIQTRLTQKNNFAMTQIMSPDEAADHVMRNMARGKFRTAFPRPFAWLFRALPVLPDWLVKRIF